MFSYFKRAYEAGDRLLEIHFAFVVSEKRLQWLANKYNWVRVEKLTTDSTKSPRNLMDPQTTTITLDTYARGRELGWSFPCPSLDYYDQDQKE